MRARGFSSQAAIQPGDILVPTADSADNVTIRDVIGNKTDTAAGDSLIALVKGVGGSQYDASLFTGTIRYVSQSGNDANGGLSPADALATIGEAISQSSAGDAIRVGYGTYDEAGLDLNLTAMELWLESGCILQDSADGTVLTVSGFGCVVRGSGNVRIDPTGGATGILVSGGFCELENLRVNCNSVGALGYDITGSGVELHFPRCSNPTTAAYKIQGDTCAIFDGCTGGNAATIGYWVTNSADKYRICNCSSQGHGVAGFQVDAGCTNGVIYKFSSGGGDGRWVDTDRATVISELSYEDEEYKSITFTAGGGVGGTGTNYNLFQVHGACRVFNIWGVVTTATPATNSVANLELYSTNASIDVTDAAGGPDMVSRVVGTVLARESVAGDPLEIGEPETTPALIENASFRDPRVPVILIEDDSADTYLQLQLSVALASGAMEWHIQWAPVSAGGFVEPA